MKRLLLEILRDHFAGRYEIETANSGVAAIERFDRQRPDAVFLDIAMPGLNGVDVLKRFQEMDRTVPVIMVTARANARVAEDCLQEGAFSWEQAERGPHR